MDFKTFLIVFQRICTTLKQIKISCPQDFNCPSRSLEEFFKAKEYRRLCMYDGVRVFKEIPDENLYKHYLLLHCGICYASRCESIEIGIVVGFGMRTPGRQGTRKLNHTCFV